DGPLGGLGVHRGQPEHAPVGESGPVRGRDVRNKGRPGGEGQERGIAIAGDPEGVPVGSQAPNSVRVYAEALLVAEPDRDLVRHPVAETAAKIELRVAGRPGKEGDAVHRLLQRDDGQAYAVAL